MLADTASISWPCRSTSMVAARCARSAGSWGRARRRRRRRASASVGHRPRSRCRTPAAGGAAAPACRPSWRGWAQRCASRAAPPAAARRSRPRRSRVAPSPGVEHRLALEEEEALLERVDVGVHPSSGVELADAEPRVHRGRDRFVDHRPPAEPVAVIGQVGRHGGGGLGRPGARRAERSRRRLLLLGLGQRVDEVVGRRLELVAGATPSRRPACRRACAPCRR